MVHTESLEDPYKFRSPPGAESRPKAVATAFSSHRSQYWTTPVKRYRRPRRRRRSSFTSSASMDAESITSSANNDRGHLSDPSNNHLKPAKVDAVPSKAPERVAKRTQTLQFALNGPQPKRPKLSESRRAADVSSEDELHGDPVQEKASPPRVLKRTNFSSVGASPRASSSRNQSPQKFSEANDQYRKDSSPERLHLEVQTAICGKEMFHAGNGSASLVLVETNAGSNIFEPLDHHGSVLNIPWLNIDIAALHQMCCAVTHSRIITFHQPADKDNVGKTALEFTSEQDAALFVMRYNDGERTSIERPIRWLQRALANFEGEARRSAELKKNSNVLPRPRVEGFKRNTQPKDLQAAAPIGRLEGLPIRRGPETRQARRSSPGFSYSERSPERWTEKHPGWERKWKHSLVYPATGRNRTTVDKDDIPRLNEGEFLNDNLVSFYLRYLQTSMEKTNPDLMRRVHIFSTFFFEKLQSLKGKAINYEGVKSWTAKIDLFSYDYLIVPVNENAHWYVAIICNVPKSLERPEVPEEKKKDSYDERRAKTGSPRIAAVEREMSDISLDDTAGPRRSIRYHSVGVSSGADAKRFSTPDPPTRARPRKSFGTPQKLDATQPRIVTLDSLGASHSPTCRSLREYLVAEAQDKRSIELTNFPTGLTAKGIPEQNNYCDCGIFVLAYVEKFLKNPDVVARNLLLKEDLGWKIDPSDMRDKVRSILFDLREE